MMNNGLYDKYEVINKETNEVAKGVFVLKPTVDYAALEALKVYAKMTDNFVLKVEIEEWISRIENPCLHKPLCPKTGERTCCAICGNRDECYEENYSNLCFLVADGEIMDKEDCNKEMIEGYTL